MLAIAFRHLLRTDERLRYTYNVVETIWRHATEQRIHIVLALGADVFAQVLTGKTKSRRSGMIAAQVLSARWDNISRTDRSVQ
jgi:hypothetical protein